jgi:nucleoid-associated protein YgaU
MTTHPDPYVVRKHDCLWDIAYRLYGRPSLWWDLAALNGISNPAGLRTGTALGVPTDGLKQHPRRHRVQKNDTYYDLAGSRLGNSARWPELARLNPQQPNQLRTGMELNVPLDFRHS